MRAWMFASLLAALPALAQGQQVPLTVPTVVAEGETTISRAPDRAWLTVAVETRDARPDEARRKNAEAMTTVQSVLKGTGVSPDAIRTTGFSLAPEMDWRDGRGTLRGYVVRNQIEVRIDDLDRLPAVLDAVNSPKGVALSVHGPRFDLKDEASIQQEALRGAVQAAMRRAEAMAAGAGRQLGQILRIQEPAGNPGGPQPMFAMRAAAESSGPPTPIVPGEIEVHARVTLTVELR